MPTYEWIPSECAPKNYPVEIVTADLFYDSTQSVYIPHGAVVNNGWGELNSSHLLENSIHPLPVRLQLVWFSYTENKFYGGVFPLPLDTLSSLFQAGFLAPFSNEPTTYKRIITGMAPNGFVSLWVSELGVTTQVTTLQAKEMDIPWEEFKQLKMTREEFVDAVLQEQLDSNALSTLKKKGVPHGLWQKYNVRFAYQPSIITLARPTDIRLYYFNGEKEFINLEREIEPGKARALPLKAELRWKNTDGKKYSATINFNEKEIFTAFETIRDKKDSKNLTLQIAVADTLPVVKVNLADDKYLIELKQADIQIYSN